MEEVKENITIKDEEMHESEKLIEKVKKVFDKHKRATVIGGCLFVLVSTNIVSVKITGKKEYGRGVLDGMEKVMSNPSMLGKGLNAFRKK